MRRLNQELNKKPRAQWLHCEFYQRLNEKLMPILFKFFQKIQNEGTLPKRPAFP